MNPIFLLFLYLLVGKNQGDSTDGCREERNHGCGVHDGMDDCYGICDGKSDCCGICDGMDVCCSNYNGMNACCDCIVDCQNENERKKDGYHGSFLDAISLNSGRKEMGQDYRENRSGVSTIAREVLRPVPPPDMIEHSSCDCEK